MAVTQNLLNTVNVASTFINIAPLRDVGGFHDQPALLIGDWVKQFILSPPFAWRWNRASITPISVISSAQDYSQSITSFGWIEKATLIDSSNNATELQVSLNIGAEPSSNKPDRPLRIAAQLDDNAGNITFRLNPFPDAAYTLQVIYQQSAPRFFNITDTWSPIPDYFSFLYNQGFIAKAYEYMEDSRFGYSMQLFVRQVIAANAGLTESQVNIFLADKLNAIRQTEEVMATSRSAKQAKGMFS